MDNILNKGLVQLGFSDDESSSLSTKMDAYIKELRLFNSAYNLINTDDYNEIVIRHILDSLSACSTIKQFAQSLAKNKSPSEKITIADIGSGGGLPGIPLAAAMPEYDFCLVERMSKRCAFLENAAAILGLGNVSVKNLEAEKVPPHSIDIAVFRAFRPLDKKMIKTLLAMIAPNGTIAAYKAKQDKINEEMDGIKSYINKYEVIKLAVPFLTDLDSSEESRERNLVLIS